MLSGWKKLKKNQLEWNDYTNDKVTIYQYPKDPALNIVMYEYKYSPELVERMINPAKLGLVLQTISYNEDLAQKNDEINVIKQRFAEMKKQNSLLPGIENVCVDFLCENHVNLPTLESVPFLMETFNQKKYDHALDLLKLMQSHGYHEHIWNFCQALHEHFCKNQPLPSGIKVNSFDVVKLLKWYESITPDNIDHYRQANARMFDIYLKLIGSRKMTVPQLNRLRIYAYESGDESYINYINIESKDTQFAANFVASLIKKYDETLRSNPSSFWKQPAAANNPVTTEDKLQANQVVGKRAKL